MPIIDKFTHRPEIDGLRAVAVLAVVLFHAGFSCSGGYVGVDVFFVISGFLITSLIWKDLESGCFAFAHFWERRVRRIVPALVVVTIATLVAGWFFLLPSDFASLGRASASQAVFAANIHYWRDSGYFAGAADEKPLLHTWSLAVEEQFYLIVPFVLWGMFRSIRLRNRMAVMSILTAGFILSFAASCYGVTRSPSATFYLLPTRAWELLLGSLIAFLPTSPSVWGHRNLRESLALGGLVLILIPVFIYTPETPFPGIAALPPCLGVALVIWTNGRSASSVPTIVGTLLALRPLVSIGLISYSLYLWHWPFLAFSKYLAPAPLSSGYRAAMLSCGLLCAILSWKFVETPFRKRKIASSMKSIFAFSGVGLATVLGCGLLCIKKHGFPSRLPAQAIEFASAKTDMSFINELTTEDIRAGKFVPIGVRDKKLPPTVLVWGDSHAMAVLPAIDAFLLEKGVVGCAATHSSTAPVLDWYTESTYGLKKDSIAFNDSVFSYIQRQQVSHVILSARWRGYVGSHSDDSNTFNSSLLTTVRRLIAVGSRPWILLDVPNHSFDIPIALARSVITQTDLSPLCAKPTVVSRFDTIDPNVIAAIETAGGQILDPKSRFTGPTGQHYMIQYNGVALYRDEQHLTSSGAKLILLPFFRDSLKLDYSLEHLKLEQLPHIKWDKGATGDIK